MTEMSPAEAVFFAAAALPPSDRAAYLARACGGDDGLRRRVEQMLVARPAVGDFLEPPPGRTVTHAPGTPTADSPAGGDRVGAVLGGRYKLVEEIGEGGMGTVFLAQQTEPVKRAVAVKVIKPGMDSKAVLARFEAERQALALMDHPNIAKVLDAGAAPDGRPYFVMELVKGVPITKFCDDRRLTPRERLGLFVPVCQAIQHAHQKGVIHRDVKPSNVLVALYDDRPVPKVIDFGVAKAAGPALTDRTLMTGFGAVVGTPEYMSPEQASLNNLDIDTRSDVYSLGVLLYELLTGTTPVDRKSLGKAALLEVLRVVREQEAPRPSAKLSTLDTLPSVAASRGTEPAKLSRLMRGELDWLVLKALEKDRARRYETAAGLGADVQRFLAGEPVQAVPPSAGYRLKKFVRRNRPQVAAAGLVLLALVAGVVGTTWGLIRADQKRREAEQARSAEAEHRLAAEANERKAAAAAAAEKAATDQTRRRLAQIERGVELFAGLLRGINPETEQPGVPPVYEQLRERAERLADALDADAVGDPLAVARLQALCGDALVELGSRDKGVQLLEKARATRERELGPDHPDTLDTLRTLGEVYAHIPSEADKAVALLERVRGARVRAFGPVYVGADGDLNNLAAAYMCAGRNDDAIAVLEKVRDASVAAYGADDRRTFTVLHNLAVAYGDTGRAGEAIPILERVRDGRVKILGADHRDTVRTLYHLGTQYVAAGRLDEAEVAYQQIRDAAVAKFGSGHRDAKQFDRNLLLVREYRRHLDRHRREREAYGPTHTGPLLALRDAAQMLIGLGLPDRAEPMLDEVLAGMTGRPPDDPIRHFTVELLQKCMGQRQFNRRNAWETFNSQSKYGGALAGIRKYAEAEPMLLEGYEGLKAREKFLPPHARRRIPEAIDRLAEFYTATGKPDEAAKWRAERAKYPPEQAPPPREKK